MTTNLSDIFLLLRQIREELPALIERSKVTAKQIITVSGLSDISERLGLVQAGEFRTGNSVEPGLGFSGVRIGYPPFLYNSLLWNVAGVEDDVLQFGLNASDGKAYFGTGAVVLDANGITIDVSAADESKIKWVDSGVEAAYVQGVSINRFKVVATNPTNNDDVQIDIEATASLVTAGITLYADDSDGSSFISIGVDSLGEVNITGGNINLAGNVFVYDDFVFNENGADLDFRIESDGDANNFFSDGGTNRIGIGTNAPDEKLHVVGNLKVTGTILGTLDNQSFSAYRSTNQTISNATFTKIQFQTEEFDADGVYDNATNYRFTPTVAGKYLITSCLSFPTASGLVIALLYKNGSRFKDGNTLANTSLGTSSTVSAVVDMNGTTDYVEIFTYQNSGGDLALTGSQNGSWFQGILQR